MQTLDSSHIRYDGVSHSTDCLTICQYNTDLNDVLEALLTFVDTCELIIPTCYTDTGNNNTVSIIESPTLQNILQSLLYQTCSGQVKVSSTDACMGWLQGKITSTDDSIAINPNIDADGCQTLDLSVNISPTNIVQDYSYTSVSQATNSSILRQITIPSGLLESDGDAIILNYDVVTNSADDHISYTTLLNGTTLNTIDFYISEFKSLTTIRISRISSTTVFITGIVTILTASFMPTPSRAVAIYSGTVTVNDLDSIDNIFYINTGTLLGATLTNQFYTMDKFNK